jgi:hypothetical protein
MRGAPGGTDVRRGRLKDLGRNGTRVCETSPVWSFALATPVGCLSRPAAALPVCRHPPETYPASVTRTVTSNCHSVTRGVTGASQSAATEYWEAGSLGQGSIATQGASREPSRGASEASREQHNRRGEAGRGVVRELGSKANQWASRGPSREAGTGSRGRTAITIARRDTGHGTRDSGLRTPDSGAGFETRDSGLGTRETRETRRARVAGRGRARK